MGSRITKREWVQLGGMRNPHVYRRQRNGRWYYYKTDEAERWQR